MNADFPTLLDVALSLIYVFFIVSLFVSGIWEFVNTVVRDRRAALLKQVLETMFADPDFVHRLFAHPLVYGQIRVRPPRPLEKFFRRVLIRRYNEQGQVVSTPAYVAPETFAQFVFSLIDTGKITLPPGTPDTALARLEAVVQHLASQPTTPPSPPLTPFSNLDDLLRSLARDAVSQKNCVLALKSNLVTWYGQYMDRVSGFFKQHSQEAIRYISLLVVLALNLDAVHLTQRLFKDPVLRGTLVENAQASVRQYNDKLKRADLQRQAAEGQIRKTFADDSLRLIDQANNGALAPQRLNSLKKIRDAALLSVQDSATTLQESLRAQRDSLFAQRAETVHPGLATARPQAPVLLRPDRPAGLAAHGGGGFIWRAVLVRFAGQTRQHPQRGRKTRAVRRALKLFSTT